MEDDLNLLMQSLGIEQEPLDQTLIQDDPMAMLNRPPEQKKKPVAQPINNFRPPVRKPETQPISPQNKQTAKQTKVQYIPDSQDMPETVRDEMRKNTEKLNKEFVDFGNQLQTISERKIGILQDGVKKRQEFSSQMASQVRDMGREQFNMTVDALKTRRAAQVNLKAQMDKIEQINSEISNYSKRIDPDFFWKRRSPQAQSSVIQGLVGMASAGVNPVALINLIQGDINREIKVQKDNIGIDIDLLKSKQAGAMQMYEYMKEVYDDDLVIDKAISSAYKERAASEIQRTAFLLQEGETQTNLMLAAEEVNKSSVNDKMAISTKLAENFQQEFATELKLQAEQREKEEFEFQKTKVMADLLNKEFTQKTKLKELKMKEEKAGFEKKKHQVAVATESSDNKQSFIQRAEGLDENQKQMMIEDDFFGQYKSPKAEQQIREKKDAGETALDGLSKLEYLVKELDQYNSLVRKGKSMLPGRVKKLEQERDAVITAITAARRPEILGPGIMTDVDFENLKKVVNLENAGSEAWNKNRKFVIEKVKESLKEVARKLSALENSARYKGGNPTYKTVYQIEYNDKYRTIRSDALEQMANTFSAYD